MGEDPKRQEAPKKAENEGRGKSRYIAALAWPEIDATDQNNKKIPLKHEQTCSETEIESTGFVAAGNDATT